jgi:hypothetical protein
VRARVVGVGRAQGADCRVLAVATRVLGRGGFCRQEMNGGDGGESNPKTLLWGVGAVGSSRPYPSSMLLSTLMLVLNQISNSDLKPNFGYKSRFRMSAS